MMILLSVCLFILQKRAVRSVYNPRARDSQRDVFKDAGIITIASQILYYNFLLSDNIHNVIVNAKYSPLKS